MIYALLYKQDDLEKNIEAGDCYNVIVADDRFWDSPGGLALSQEYSVTSVLHNPPDPDNPTLDGARFPVRVSRELEPRCKTQTLRSGPELDRLRVRQRAPRSKDTEELRAEERQRR